GRPGAAPLPASPRRAGTARGREGERPAAAGGVADQPEKPADRPGDRQPRLATPLRPGARAVAEQLRQTRPPAPPPRHPPPPPQPPDRRPAAFAGAAGSTKGLPGPSALPRPSRLASTDDAGARARDPDDELLWRFPRRRLDAEAIRDSLLAVSGALDRSAGGPH